MKVATTARRWRRKSEYIRRHWEATTDPARRSSRSGGGAAGPASPAAPGATGAPAGAGGGGARVDISDAARSDEVSFDAAISGEAISAARSVADARVEPGQQQVRDEGADHRQRAEQQDEGPGEVHVPGE